MPALIDPVPLDGWTDPADAFAGVAAEHPHVFWLDAGPEAVDGWSWVGWGEVEDDPNRVRAVVCADAPAPAPGGALRGGWVGWLDYEGGARHAGAPVAASDGDGERWVRIGAFWAFDHAERRVWSFGAGKIAGADAAPPPVTPVTASARTTPEEYAAQIERCRDRIAAGDAYQLCLTTRFEIPHPVDPLGAYARLRSTTPAHHGGLLRAGDVALASASPERFLEVTDGVVRTSPIKGTRPRGVTPGEDDALSTELRESEKERAENVMIVDLMRNDLSRVCVPGSVGVDALLAVESYPAVHQLVSTVSGTLRAGTTVGDLVDAAFPAGSMTGAPKLSAMTILHGLEGGARGIYAGAFGWVGVDGALDLAMVIRSIVVRPDGAYVGAGGGITWRSDAAAEVAEVGVKARGPLAAVGAALPPGW